MSDADVKQVKVDNWGTYFLQRLKHFFNRTDYCDLTLQFQDNAQLKVHRLVLSACTEYFELLERTCEMYEDCLVMPDDLQADVVVPIVNFMYTGHLEFHMDLLERLYQTSQILNMPVLTKLLEAHRQQAVNPPPKMPFKSSAKKYTKSTEPVQILGSRPSTSTKRSYGKAFNNHEYASQPKKVYGSTNRSEVSMSTSYSAPSPASTSSKPTSSKKSLLRDPRPTRYEVPEELDADNIFNSSFSNISYASQPIVVHPETVKRYSANRSGLFNESSSSRKLGGLSTLDIVECKKIPNEDNIFDDTMLKQQSDEHDNSTLSFQLKREDEKDSSQLFDEILDEVDGPKVTLETKGSKHGSNIDHAKIISEVLKKYPHLVKGNKNIKLKILDTPSKTKKVQKSSYCEPRPLKVKSEMEADFTYETDVLDSKAAANLIALGAENIKGPWICLICGTPGKALHFTTYYKFRRHLVDVHNEKPVSNICEYCGLKSLKRNYMLHHLYSQHGIKPPPQYNFPKCNKCNYIALTEGFLVKHKLTHKESSNFRCNVCSVAFNSSNALLKHIQFTGHKYSAEKKKPNLQCVYCLKVFLRETNLYTHLSANHKKEAERDGIIEVDSDDDPKYENQEPSTSYAGEDQFHIREQSDRGIQVLKQDITFGNHKQKILNTGFGAPKSKPVVKQPAKLNYIDVEIPKRERNQEEIVMIDNNEYVMRDSQLIPTHKQLNQNEEYIVSDMLDSVTLPSMQPSTSMDYGDMHHNLQETQPMIIKKASNLNQPIQIVVSNEEEYKALMSSNHPIIFDDGDTSKTLAVLTAPRETSLQPHTIDLNNAQANNMMIIQDDYPLNVSEAVTAANSNIVVVYSHSVDENKQYQIITTQGIEPQFSQTSAIITQNYETVTTSTPVMSAHILPTQEEQAWSSNVPNIATEPMQITQDVQLHTITEQQDLEMATVERQSNDLQHEAINEHEINSSASVEQVEGNQPNENVNEVSPLANDKIVPDSHYINHTPMPEDTQTEAIVEEHQNNPETEPSMPADEITATHADTNISQHTNVSQDNDLISQDLVIQLNNNVSNIMDIDSTDNENIVQPENIHTTNTDENLIQAPEDNNVPMEQLTQQSQEYSVPIEDQHPALVSQEYNVLTDSSPPEDESQDLSESVVEDQQESHEISETLEESHQIEEAVEQTQDSNTVIEETDEINEVIEASHEMSEAIEESQVYEEPAGDMLPPQECDSALKDSIIIQKAKELSLTVETESDTIKSSNVLSDACNKEVVKEIQNLTSEWSEDEYDVATDDSQPEAVTNPVTTVNNSDKPVEESIENIQQEIENQTVKLTEKTVEDHISTQKDPQQPENDPKEKISSLLNDWEDNDSQENISTNDSLEENGLVNDNEHPIDAVPEKQESKIENIKKLVSDWDEDEEEEMKEL